jgi:hypothetical protein
LHKETAQKFDKRRFFIRRVYEALQIRQQLFG